MVTINILRALLFCISSFAAVKAQSSTVNESVVSIPASYAYLLPHNYVGNVSQRFVDTKVSGNNTVTNLLSAARKSPFISYTSEFTSLVGGSNTSVQMIASQNSSSHFAYEAGVWVPELNQVWFTSAIGHGQPCTALSVLDLATNEVLSPNITGDPVVCPNGGYYFNGTVYMCLLGNETYPSAIVAIDPATGASHNVVNSYFGLRFNGIDDVSWANTTNGSAMFFTDLDFSSILSTRPGGYNTQLADAVWRFNPTLQQLQPVISRQDILVPNGVRVNANSTRLYVTSSEYIVQNPSLATGMGSIGGGNNSFASASPAIYVYDLDDTMTPVNRRVFGYAREGIADGIHVDDAGRVWTAEYEGVVVRSAEGQVLGVFNTEFFSNSDVEIANFALAGDKLIFLALNRIWAVQLSETVVSATRGGS